MTPFEHALVMREAGAVKRYHTVRTHRTQDLAAHTFGVLCLLTQVMPDCRKEVMLAVMHHDLPELITGDIPAPIKRVSPTLQVALEEVERGTAPLFYNTDHLTPLEAAAVKWCDTFELVLFCLEEIMMGNLMARSALRNGLVWCQHEQAARMLLGNGYTSATVRSLLDEALKAAEGFTKEKADERK